MFYLRIKLICVWFNYVVCFISITCFSCHQPPKTTPMVTSTLSIHPDQINIYTYVYVYLPDIPHCSQRDWCNRSVARASGAYTNVFFAGQFTARSSIVVRNISIIIIVPSWATAWNRREIRNPSEIEPCVCTRACLCVCVCARACISKATTQST